MTEVTAAQLAKEMEEFLRELPTSAGLEWTLDSDYLMHFEAQRMLLMRKALQPLMDKRENRLRVLDFGYLHGLVPEFLHRMFSNAEFTVLDRADSPAFSNPDLQRLVAQRDYVRLLPCDIEDCETVEGQFDLIVLGEIIEHLNPTAVRDVLEKLRKKIFPNGILLITTPNGAGFYNLIRTLIGKDAQHPPIADATMGMPHIHLWTPNLLSVTLTHANWVPSEFFYYHGREAEAFAEGNRHWSSLVHQLFLKTTQVITTLHPQWRGFYVMTARPQLSTEVP